MTIYSRSSVQNFHNWRFGTRKNKAIISQQNDIDKIYFYAKDLSYPSIKKKKKSAKMQEQNTSMIQMHLLSLQILWMMFMRMLMITIQNEKEKS